MATTRKTKKTTKTTKSKIILPDTLNSELKEDLIDESIITPQNLKPKRRFIRYTIIAVVVLLAIALVVRNKSLFIAAIVNGKPIYAWDLNKKLNERFGGQLLEAMIGEKLIAEAAQKSGVNVSENDVNSRIAEIEKSLTGSMKLEDALKLQGVSKGEFKNQVKVQLLIDKMLSKDVSVSAAEVDEYVKGTSNNLTASDPAERRTQAEKEILNNKISEKFQEWFNNLKSEAKINRFL